MRKKLCVVLRALTFSAVAGSILVTAPAVTANGISTTDGECSYQDSAFNDGWGYNHATGESCPPRPTAGQDHLVIQFKGTALAVPTEFDSDGDGIADISAPCFEAPIFDPSTGREIGTGADCLDVQSNDDGNIRLTGTGFFDLDDGTIVVQGLTTVRPVLQPTRRGDIEFTHITGANSDGGVIYGTGRYQGASGAVRLSRQVDMSRLDAEGIIHFDCIFIIDFS